MAGEDAVYSLANVGVDTSIDGDGVAYGGINLGAAPVPTRDSAFTALENVGFTPATREARVLPQFGWGEPLRGKQNLTVFDHDSRATAQSAVEVVAEPPA